MRVADVYCATCGARIGWRFCADLSPGLENCNQALLREGGSLCRLLKDITVFTWHWGF